MELNSWVNKQGIDAELGKITKTQMQWLCICNGSIIGGKSP